MLYRVMVLVFLVFAMNGFAWAQVNDIYMTNATGSSEKKDPPNEFALNETPWVFIESSFTEGNWFRASDSAEYFFNTTDAGSNFFMNQGTNAFNESGYWISPKNWNEIGEAGNWKVHKIYIDGEKSPAYSINFKVAPEPVSCALFLLGGGALAVMRKRKA